MFTTEENRWKAVQTRNPTASKAFVYAVMTTRIYCRPTCPARLARRANVLFFDNHTQATAAGFRACKRCQPQESTAPNRAAKLVEKACALIRDVQGRITLDQLSKQLSISPRYLHHVFCKNAGCSPAIYAARFKYQRTKNKVVSPPDGSAVLDTDSIDSNPDVYQLYPAGMLDILDFSDRDVESIATSTPKTNSTEADLNSWTDAENLEIAFPFDEMDLSDINLYGDTSLWSMVDFDQCLLDTKSTHCHASTKIASAYQN